MDKTITATEANRQFSAVLRLIRDGGSVTITVHGEPVADIVPHRRGRSLDERQREQFAFIEYLRSLPAGNAEPWTRDELYDDDPDGTD